MKMAQAQIRYESIDGKTVIEASIAIPQPVSLTETERTESQLHGLTKDWAEQLKLTSEKGIVWSEVEE